MVDEYKEINGNYFHIIDKFTLPIEVSCTANITAEAEITFSGQRIAIIDNVSYECEDVNGSSLKVGWSTNRFGVQSSLVVYQSAQYGMFKMGYNKYVEQNELKDEPEIIKINEKTRLRYVNSHATSAITVTFIFHCLLANEISAEEYYNKKGLAAKIKN